ncbi:MAG: hypothetical protein KA006_00305 [Neisseria sp.]|nr:hypothetical protein [Neisseria sp.]
MLYISDATRAKLLTKHQVGDIEVMEAFGNREKGFLEDARAENQTIPPTQWFIAETNKGRLLKVVFIATNNGCIVLKTAYDANSEEIRIYNKYA